MRRRDGEQGARGSGCGWGKGQMPWRCDLRSRPACRSTCTCCTCRRWRARGPPTLRPWPWPRPCPRRPPAPPCRADGCRSPLSAAGVQSQLPFWGDAWGPLTDADWCLSLEEQRASCWIVAHILRSVQLGDALVVSVDLEILGFRNRDKKLGFVGRTHLSMHHDPAHHSSLRGE